MSGACQCHVCKLTRRHKEIKTTPSFDAYEGLVNDMFEYFLNEDLDANMKIVKMQEEIDKLKGIKPKDENPF